MIIELAPATSCLQWRAAALPKALSKVEGYEPKGNGNILYYHRSGHWGTGYWNWHPWEAGKLTDRNVCVTLGAQTGMSVLL